MFPFFPYTNFHELNADWILKTVKNLADAVSQIANNIAHVVRVTAQTFTPSEKAQARQNIGAISANDLPDMSDVVRYSAQDLTPTQQTRTRLNIGATSQADIELLLATKHYVKYDEQTLTSAQQAQARANIGAIAENDLPDISDVVRYSAQARTPEQKLRARTNIGAAYSGDIDDLVDRVTDVENVAGIALTYAPQTPTIAQKAQARSNIGAGSAVDVQTNADEIQKIYGDLNSLVNLLTITATLTGETIGTWTGATWNTIKDNIQHGKVFCVTIAGTDSRLYVMFTGIGTVPNTTEVANNTEMATSIPFLMNNSYQWVTVTSNGDFSINSV